MPGDMGFEEWKGKFLKDEKDLHSEEKSGIFNSMDNFDGDTNTISGATSGSLSGALEPYSPEAEQHAELYYDSVRSMKTDVNHIADNTGFSRDEIKSIKDHVFFKEHDLGDGEKTRFAPSYDMSQSWQRLIDGKHIEPHDITLLKHELLEIEYMKKGYSQYEAHELTNEKYSYQNALEKWREKS